MTLDFNYKTETKTCYRFETGERPEQMTLYLKKKLVDEAGIDPKQGITVTIEQQKED
ncbi:MAG: hypothetical protein ACOYU3_07435 [Bacillota bacterium]